MLRSAKDESKELWTLVRGVARGQWNLVRLLSPTTISEQIAMLTMFLQLAYIGTAKSLQ